MQVQIIEGVNGKPAGVFIPIEEWDILKTKYPDIENNETQLPNWEEEIIDARLNAIEANPDRLKNGMGFLNALKQELT